MGKLIYLLILLLIVEIRVSGQTKNLSGSFSNELPNFVLIVADDLGYADLGIHGSTQIPTPNIDKLAAQGVRFTQGYVTAPVCSPSRAGLLTGKNQVSFGYDNNIGGNQPGFDPQYLGLPLDEKTIADHLRPLGYVSGLIGKWHLGDEPQFHPLQRGFDEFWGYTGGGHDYFTSSPEGKGYLSPIESNYKTPQPLTYITDDKGDECVSFIRRHKERPFFLYASFNAPHAPMQATEADLALFGHIQDKKRGTYCAMVHRLDVNVGKILKTLEEENLEKNTMVVFISDNGGPVDSNASINAPLNGQKGILMEGGIRVPFFIKWPGIFPAGKVSHEPVISTDLLPTFLEATGKQNQWDTKFDGVSLIPYLTGKSQKHLHTSLLWKFTISAAILEGEWKLIRLPDRLPMLYNLKEDISELNDLAGKYPDLTGKMLRKLGLWDVGLPHPLFLEGAVWKKRQLELYDMQYPLNQP